MVGIVIVDDFRFRVMNIHPALIPSFCGHGFYGYRVHEAVLERGAKVSGCTVHFADNQYDHGPIILQSCVAVADDETPQTLAQFRRAKGDLVAYIRRQLVIVIRRGVSRQSRNHFADDEHLRWRGVEHALVKIVDLTRIDA